MRSEHPMRSSLVQKEIMLGSVFEQAGYRLSYATTETVRPRPRRCRCRCRCRCCCRCLRVTGGSSCGAHRRRHARRRSAAQR